MTLHGLSAATALGIAAQLGSECLSARARWRRAMILDRLQFDVFRWYFRRHNPDFATFFLNSTAHLQHVHWRNMDPEPFKIKPTNEEQREYPAGDSMWLSDDGQAGRGGAGDRRV